MNPQYLARATSKIPRTRHLYRPITTTTSTSDPPPQPRPLPPPLPPNIARSTLRTNNNPTRDAGIAHANSMMQDIDRTKYNRVRDYDAHRANLNDVDKVGRARDLERQMPRTSRWQVGDVYAPHDLSVVEAAKWRKRKSSERDVFDILGIDPLEEYKVCVWI